MSSRYAVVSALVGLLACAGGNRGAEAGPPEAPEPQLSIQVSPDTLAQGATARIVATGFPADTTVQIGFGPPNSEYEVIAEARSDAQGRVETRVEVPDWAEVGRRYVFVAVMPDNQPKVVSEPLLVR